MNTEQALRERAEAILNIHIAGDVLGYFGEHDTSLIVNAMIDFHKQELSGKEIYEAVEIKDGCEMPKEGVNVFVLGKNENGKKYRAIAMYTSGGKIEFDDEFEDFPECYDEKDGVSYLPNGWWEQDADEEKTYQRNPTHWLKKLTLSWEESSKH